MMEGSDQTIQRGKKHSRVEAVLFAGLVAGTFDALAAIIVYGPVFGKVTAARIFQGIASAVFGKSALQGGALFAVYGLIFHYLIALSFSAAYGLAYPRMRFLQKHPLVSGILYGAIVWAVMNKLVLPLAGMRGPVTFSNVVSGMAILVVCVGLPIAVITHRFSAKLHIALQRQDHVR